MLRRLFDMLVTKCLQGYLDWQLGIGRLWGRDEAIVMWNFPYSSRIGSWLFPVHQPLMYPSLVEASKAHHMRDDDMVVGILVRDEARAYPWWIMDNHHLANDMIKETSITILFCEACSTAVAFNSVVNGARLPSKSVTFTTGRLQ